MGIRMLPCYLPCIVSEIDVLLWRLTVLEYVYPFIFSLFVVTEFYCLYILIVLLYIHMLFCIVVLYIMQNKHFTQFALIFPNYPNILVALFPFVGIVHGSGTDWSYLRLISGLLPGGLSHQMTQTLSYTQEGFKVNVIESQALSNFAWNHSVI